MLSKHSSCFFVSVVSIVFIVACSSPPLTTTVEVTGGTIEGVDQDGVFSYKGIPFAAPPVADLRWKAPQPTKAWTGVRNADTFAPGCMQDSSMSAMTGAPANFSEDCLYLNVWTAAKTAGEKRPVMVWIHGGAFVGGMTGTPMFDGTKFAQKGVVLVSIAYRLGVFGFMAHPELSRESGRGSGTYGIQDMIAGLQWVKDNIARFGGDPSCVTIFGESAGGIAVGMLSAAPPAKGLFHRAISESGGSFAPPRIEDGAGQNVPALKLAESDGESFLKKLGASDMNAARALPAEQIQEAAGGGMGGVRFWPVADGYVIPGDPYELYEKGRFNDTPILAGTNSNEGGLFMRGPVNAEEFEKQIRSGYGERADVILEAYPHSTDAEAARASADVFREFAFAWPTWAWARMQSRMGDGKAFVYYYDHRTPASPDGANHAAEVSYVFGNFAGPGGAPRPEDLALSELIQTYWINFAATGDPNRRPALPLWPNFTEQDQQVLYFDDSASAKPIPNLEKLKAFDSYYSWRREQAREKIGQ